MPTEPLYPRGKAAEPVADEIAEMATRGDDVSAYFTNKFAVVRPVKPGLTPSGKKAEASG
jgi:hypothetical protein